MDEVPFSVPRRWRSRAAIAGTGFIGRVHARAAATGRRRARRRRRLVARSAAAAAAELGAERAFDSRRGAGRRDPTSTSSTSARPTTCTCRSPRPRCEPASTSSARSRWRPTPSGRAAARRDRGGGSGRQAAVPFVYRFYPTVREARERVRERTRRRAAPAPRHATSRTGSSRPDDTTGGWTTSSAGRPARSPTSARTGATSPSSSPATASPGSRRACSRPCRERSERAAAGTRSDGAATAGAARAVDDRGRGARPVRDRRRGARLGRRQPGLGRAQEPAVDRGRRQRGGDRLRPGAPRGALVRAPRVADASCAATRPTLSPPAARYASLPAGHPQGYADCFDAFVADFYDGDPAGSARRRARRRSPTGCARRASPTPCWPRARGGRWVEVAASRVAVGDRRRRS